MRISGQLHTMFDNILLSLSGFEYD